MRRSENNFVFFLSFHFYMSLEAQIQVIRLSWCLNLLLCCCDKTVMENQLMGRKGLFHLAASSPSRKEMKAGT